MTAETGLRERKRAATSRAIQLAALELIGERGLDAVTVEDIARRADISPRTLFNYFSSKEEAFIGASPRLDDAVATARFIDGSGAILDDLAGLVLTAVSAGLDDLDVLYLRRRLMKQYPQIAARRAASMREFEDDLARVIEQRLRREAGDASADPGAVMERAHLLTLVAVAAMRHAWSLWADGDQRVSLPSRVRRSFQLLESVLGSGPAG
jgi:AcrR family transcriptional regulator